MKSYFASSFFKKIQILILSLAAFLLSACADLTSGVVYEKSVNAKYMYITLESADTALAITSARSITAPAIDFTDPATQNYCFYVWGKSSKGTVSPKKVYFDSSTGSTGTVEIDFPITSYSFVLAVTETEPLEISTTEILKDAIFVGYTNADLSYSKTVKFSLSTGGLKSPGAVYLNFYLDSTWLDSQVTRLLSNYKARVCFYTKDGVAKSGEMGLEGLSKTVPIYSANWFRSLAAGEYEMRVTIREEGGEQLVYTYSDNVIVAPNRKIEADVYIPNILLDLPEAPTDFKAAHCMDYRFYKGSKSTVIDNGDGTYSSQPAENGIELTSNADIEKYEFTDYGILFSWTDNANNETGFKITLVDVTKIADGHRTTAEILADLPTVMTDSYWNSLVQPFEGQSSIVKVFKPETYKNSSDYILGSLEKNKTSLIVYGSFGSCYIAKIEAVNLAGLSKACYVRLDEDFNVEGYVGKAFASASNPCKVINRYKILYHHFQGGTIVYTQGPLAPIVQEPKDYVIEYHTFGEGKLICYSGTSSGEATIENPMLYYFGNGIIVKKDSGGNVISSTPARGTLWSRWTIGSYGGIDYPGTAKQTANGHDYIEPADYTGYTSLYLFARYD